VHQATKIETQKLEEVPTLLATLDDLSTLHSADLTALKNSKGETKIQLA
jgi:hypothetical protein